MTDIIVCHNDNSRLRIPVNDHGNLCPSCLKTHFSSAHGLTYEDEEGEIQRLAVDSEQVISKPKVKDVHASKEDAPTGKRRASANTEENCNKKHELTEKCSEEDASNETQEVSMDKSAKVKYVIKTLRVGWLNKAAGDTKYRKMTKPRGGVKRLKLDVTAPYLAHQIRRMAIDAFESSEGENCAIEDEYEVNLGDFGGQVILDFSRKDGKVCDIWEYCKDRGKGLYQLNFFMLTSPIDEEAKMLGNDRTISTRRTKALPKIVNDVRVLYQYFRRSRYSNALSRIEYEKPALYDRVFDDQCGDVPSIEDFKPSDYNYSISRIEKSDDVLVQIYFDDNLVVESIEFPASMRSNESLEEHSIVHDVDRLHGYSNWKFGIGFVPSCTNACKPIFSWYKDGELFKKCEYLYWLDNIKDGKSHLWSCTVTCRTTERQLQSKQILIDAL